MHTFCSYFYTTCTYWSNIIEAVACGYFLGEIIVDATLEAHQEWAGEYVIPSIKRGRSDASAVSRNAGYINDE